MNHTYKVVARNCEAPNIEITAEGNRFAVAEYVELLQKGFRFVEVYDNETGEVVYTFYRSHEWFEPTVWIAKCVDQLVIKVKNNRAHY